MRPIVQVTLLACAAAAWACASSGAQQPITRAPEPQAAIATRHPYEMDGRVQAVGGGLLGARSVTVAREDAPAAEIHVADHTRIVLDGRESRLSDLRPGDDVRVVFDFDRDSPVAIRIDAKPHR